MATQTVPASKIDTEIVVYDVRHLTALATWIESARQVIENIQDSRRLDWKDRDVGQPTQEAQERVKNMDGDALNLNGHCQATNVFG